MTVAEYAAKAEDRGPLVNEIGADLVVISMPREVYDLVIETLEVDSQASNFDRELRERISDALDQMHDITAAVSRVIGCLDQGLSALTGALCLAGEEE